jgi:hypothetical protein
MQSRAIRGQPLVQPVPEWGPLLALAPGHIDDFVWMFSVDCADGTRIHAYKHWRARRYLHLSEEGRGFVWRSPNRYYEIDPHLLLDLVVA